MHDGRFATLDEVLDYHSHGIQDVPTLDPGLGWGHLFPRFRTTSHDIFPGPTGQWTHPSAWMTPQERLAARSRTA